MSLARSQARSSSQIQAEAGRSPGNVEYGPGLVSLLGAAGISALQHDLENPLAAIDGFAELLQSRGDESVRLEASRRITEACASLRSQLDDVLTLLALESGTLALSCEQTELRRALAEAVDAVGSQCARRLGSVRVDGAAVEVVVDRMRLVQILRHLLRVAADEGAQPRDLALGVERVGASALVGVTVAPGSKTVDADASVGLVVARGLLELHGGRLLLGEESPNGGGPGFMLPLARAAEPTDVSGRRRVIVADDDVAVRSLLRLTLAAERVEVVEACDGEEALELSRVHVPDLVLLDWRMPGCSGAVVLAELKRRHPEVPVIVLTAEQAPASRAEAETLGADTFLTKPFSPLELLKTVEQLLPELLDSP